MEFPCFHGTIKALRLPPVLPTTLRFLRAAGTKSHSGFAPVGGVPPRGPGVVHPVPPSGLFLGDDRGSHVPGEPLVLMPCSPTPAGPNTPDQFGASTRPPLKSERRLPRLDSFRGSITRLRHSLSTLRREDRSSTTQDSLPAAGQALPVGFGYPQGPDERFRDISYISSSFPKLRGARFSKA